MGFAVNVTLQASKLFRFDKLITEEDISTRTAGHLTLKSEEGGDL